MSRASIPYVRTPPERFQNLPDFAYEAHYLQYGNLRMAYIEEQQGTGSEVFLCIHGQPTWSYVYRKMIPVLLGYTTLNQPISRRVIAPDMFGFGRSDKPTREADYTFQFHRDALLFFIETLDLTNITLVVQDWGGLLGLSLPLADPRRFRRLIVMNTTIAVGEQLSQGFLDWRNYSNRTPDMPVGTMMRRSVKHLSSEEADAYDAPYPNIDYKSGVRRFPNLVMVEENMDGVEISKRSVEFFKSANNFATEDIFMACGLRDPVLGPKIMERLSLVWKNGCYYANIVEAGHFVQEWGDVVARLAIEVFEGQGTNEGVQKRKPTKAAL